MYRSAHLFTVALTTLALLASNDGCALEAGGTGGDRAGKGGAVPDGGPSRDAGGLGGAGGKSSTDAGTASDGPGGSGADSGAGSPYANFAAVRDIVSFKCGGSGCHSGETEPRLVDEPKLYTTLTTYVAKKCGNRLLIKAGSPQESAFYLAQKGLCGSALAQMPLGCVDNCTPADYVEGVRQWIANGASQQ